MIPISLQVRGKWLGGSVVTREEEWTEIILNEPADLECDEEVKTFGLQAGSMRVIHSDGAELILAPSDAELFHIYSDPFRQEDWLAESGDGETVRSYKINAFGTIHNAEETHSIRIVDVSRLGIGFAVNDLSIKFQTLYNAMIMCGSVPIFPTIAVNYAHLKEKTIRYCAELKWISPEDLHTLRYFLAMKSQNYSMV